MEDEFYVPPQEQLRRQSQNNKQARGEEELSVDVQERILELLKKDQSNVYSNYEGMLSDGLARELARINLPLSLYTQWYWQIDLHNLFHFLKLRLDSHAQYEIRAYGEVMATMAKAVAPIAYEAFEEHILYAVKLSRSSREKLQKLLESMDQSSSEVQEAKTLLQ